MPDFEYIIRRKSSNDTWIQSIVDSSDTFNIYPGDIEGTPDLYTEINTDLLQEPTSYPGDLWPYRGLKIELPYLYLEHINSSNLTNGVIEVFLFDGAVTEDAETLEPCTITTLLNQLHGDSECDVGNIYLDNRIFAAQWCGNGNGLACQLQDSDVWFDLQHSFNEQSLPYIEDIPFSRSTTSWNFEQCPSDIHCWGWTDSAATNLDNVETIDLSLLNSEFNEDFDLDYNIWSESLKKDYNLTPADYFYIITRVGGSDVSTDWMGNSYQRFAIPKNIFRKLILNKQEEIFIGFGNNGAAGFNSGPITAFSKLGIDEFDKTFSMPEVVYGEGETSYSVNALAIKITPPSDQAYDITDSANLPPDSFHSVRIEGIVAGGYTDSELNINMYNASPGDNADGEVQFLPNEFTFIHPDGTSYEVDQGNGTVSQMENVDGGTTTSDSRAAYLVFVGTDETRFTMDNAVYNKTFIVAYWNGSAWTYDDNTGYFADRTFPPNTQDVIVARLFRDSNQSPGIESAVHYYRSSVGQFPWIDINTNQSPAGDSFDPMNNTIDYASLSLYSTPEFEDYLSFTDNFVSDFRPISNAFISIAGNDYSLQSYYDPYTFQYDITSAPLTLSLSFDISNNLYNVDYLNEDSWNGSVNSDYIGNYEIGYKFRVVQWGDEPSEEQYEDDQDFINNWDTSDLEQYPFQDVRLGPNNPGEVQHTYLTNISNEIKVFVFSYIRHPLQPNFVQALKWKIVTVKIHLNDILEAFHTRGLEDFGALGGADFITIPWPHPGSTPVISGISDRSKYKKSLAMLSRGGRYESQNDPDYIFIKTADRNEELGDYLGKADIEQVRVFNNGSYDMHTLLGITPIQDDIWKPYTDNSYWTGNPVTVDEPIGGPTFPSNTSIGELYVDENGDNDLRNDCILELNLGDVENGTIRDTSGSGNKGMLLGDYSLEKIDKNLPTMRDSAMSISEVGEDDKAL